MAVTKADRTLDATEQEAFASSYFTRGMVWKKGAEGIRKFVEKNLSRFKDSDGKPSGVDTIWDGPNGDESMAAFVLNNALIVKKPELAKLNKVVIGGEEAPNVYEMDEVLATDHEVMGKMLKAGGYVIPSQFNILGVAIRRDDEGEIIHSAGRELAGFNTWATTERAAGRNPNKADFIDSLKKEGKAPVKRSGFNKDNMASMSVTILVGNGSDLKK